MVSSPWKLMTLVTLLSSVYQVSENVHPRAEIKNRFQLVVDDERLDEYTVTLDGSPSAEAETYKWDLIEKPKNTTHWRFSAKREMITNVTLENHKGMYRFQLRASATKPGTRRKKHSDAFSKVYIEKPSSVGMYLFSSNVVTQLLMMHYQYIALGQYHQRAVHYHPNVAAYFRKLAADRAEMLNDVTEHILAKQATEDLVNSCPTDYVQVMMTQGFKPKVTFNYNVTDFMTSGFEIAQESEAQLARELSHVVHHAERNHDYELSEFAAAELLPQVTKVMNSHKNYLETVLRPADTSPTPKRHLVEFLFDKHLKI